MDAAGLAARDREAQGDSGSDHAGGTALQDSAETLAAARCEAAAILGSAREEAAREVEGGRRAAAAIKEGAILQARMEVP